MFELLIPYIIAVALGIDPAAGSAAATDATAKDKDPTALAEATEAAEATPAAPLREPETQIPTGRFTTAIEVKPILGATRPQWIAVREYDGQDLLYFTNLLAWRCALWEVRYGLNGAAPDIVLPLEPCHEDTAQPNALVDSVTYPIWIEAPLGSIDSIEVEIDYDDGTTDAAVYARQSVLMPG
jgi:hypothetical protein